MMENNFNIGDIEENIKRGLLEMLILKALCQKDLYGYEISGILNEKSGDKLHIKEGSLYGPIYRLLEKNYISENPVLVGKRRTRIYFRIEPLGREYLQKLIDIYLRMNEGVMQIITGDSENEQG